MNYTEQEVRALTRAEIAATAKKIYERIKRKIETTIYTAEFRRDQAKGVTEREYYNGIWLGLVRAMDIALDVCYDREIMWWGEKNDKSL